MAGHCRDCRYWAPITDHGVDGGGGEGRVMFPPQSGENWWDVDRDEASIKARGLHLVRRCTSPDVLFYQRPARNGAAIFDGSEYRASLFTGEDFGCVLFEAVSLDEPGPGAA
jgi:hypothetical protein